MPCSTCKSSRLVPLVIQTLQEVESGTKETLCRDSFHPPQAYVPLGGQLKQSCGPHCGIKDKMEGHCDCLDCHNGNMYRDGLSSLKSLEGKSVSGVRPD